MSSPTNKPRDIKNLKARLGRTITPGQAGMPGAAPGAGSVPPSAPGGFPGAPGGPFGSAPGGVPRASRPPGAGNPFGGPAGVPRPSAPPGAARPGSAPGLGGGVPGGATPAPGGLPRPVVGGGLPKPVVGPAAKATPSAAPAAAKGGVPAKGGTADPFTAVAPGAINAEKKVTLVIDSSAVNEAEIGRKSAMKSGMLVVVGAVVGIAIGWGVGGTTQEREQFRLAVEDGKEIYSKVQETSKVIEAAQQSLKKAVDAAQSRPGATPTVDSAAIKSLVAMERPFKANEFHRRRYRAFPSAVVDDLFDYYNNINLIWDKFALLNVKTAGKKLEALNESAKAADGLIKTQYGAVLSKTGEVISAGLVYVEIPEGAEPPPEDDKKGKKDKELEGPKVQVSSAQGGKSVEREVYIGQEGFAEDFAKYVIMLDKIRSRTILGEGASLFAEYQGILMEINGLMTKVVESQGRLTKELGKVAALASE